MCSCRAGRWRAVQGHLHSTATQPDNDGYLTQPVWLYKVPCVCMCDVFAIKSLHEKINPGILSSCGHHVPYFQREIVVIIFRIKFRVKPGWWKILNILKWIFTILRVQKGKKYLSGLLWMGTETDFLPAPPRCPAKWLCTKAVYCS